MSSRRPFTDSIAFIFSCHETLLNTKMLKNSTFWGPVLPHRRSTPWRSSKNVTSSEVLLKSQHQFWRKCQSIRTLDDKFAKWLNMVITRHNSCRLWMQFTIYQYGVCMA